jgi:hypothetical protein
MVRSVTALIALLVGVTGLLGHSSARTTHAWMQNGFTASQFVKADSSVASYFFKRSGSYGTSTNGPASSPTEPYSATTPVLRFTSEAQLASDIASKVIPNSTWPKGSYVLYDNESGSGWPTPADEQRDPEKYMPMFNSAAVKAGFIPVDTPALDRGKTATPGPKGTHGGSNLTWYEQCDIAKYAVADGGSRAQVVVQTQSETTSKSAFAALYNDAKSDATGENASATVYAELSQSYGTAADAVNDLGSVGQSVVMGVYLQDTNADAGQAGGWEGSVLTALKNKGW